MVSENKRPLVRVVLDIGYLAYKDDQDMIEHATSSMYEDLMHSIKYNELHTWIEVVDAPDANESDIPGFLLENIDEETDVQTTSNSSSSPGEMQ